MFRRIVQQTWRVWLLALVLPLMFADTLPIFARLASGPAVHVCHCDASRGHATCACPICHPDRDDLKLSAEAIRGTCGDDDVAYGSASNDVAILPHASLVFVTPIDAPLPRVHAMTAPRDFISPIDTPPPRQA